MDEVQSVEVIDLDSYVGPYCTCDRDCEEVEELEVPRLPMVRIVLALPAIGTKRSLDFTFSPPESPAARE